MAILLPWLLISHASRADQDPVPLTSGEKAPYDGILMTNERAAKLADRVERCEFKLELEPQVCQRKAEVQHDADVAKLKIESRASDQREAMLLEQLETMKQAARREFWEEPPVLITAGALLGVGIFLGATLVVGYLRPAIPPVTP